MLSFPHPPHLWRQLHPPRVYGNKLPLIKQSYQEVQLRILLKYFPTKQEKALPTRLFIIPFVTSFLRFYQQSHTLHVMCLRNSKGSGNLLRINCVSPTSLHTPRGAFEEINPPAGLSSTRIPILGRV